MEEIKLTKERLHEWGVLLFTEGFLKGKDANGDDAYGIKSRNGVVDKHLTQFFPKPSKPKKDKN